MKREIVRFGPETMTIDIRELRENLAKKVDKPLPDITIENLSLVISFTIRGQPDSICSKGHPLDS